MALELIPSETHSSLFAGGTPRLSDAILNDNDRKAELSYAYLAALSAMAGYTCQKGPQPDKGSVDAIVMSGGSMASQLDVQLKATSSPNRLKDGLHFRLKRKNYDDMRRARTCRIYLVVLELPAESTEWLECSTEELILRRCAWWQSLSGYPEIESQSKVVVIDALQRLIDLARQGPTNGDI